MLALLASALVVAAFAGLVYRYAPKPSERWGMLLERYRPHAPMSDWSAMDYEAARQYSDLAAVRAYREPEPPRTPAALVRRKSPVLPDLSGIPCRGETVQF
ncbi:hypothetical protein [Nocardia jejuensis]|uniref:hypothetical protein n=1 Tax=Nocardia jejuensis TaxID=328049 RepID=UPI00082C41A0|nr:hypothetical protein [Nocardia jejuensis]